MAEFGEPIPNLYRRNVTGMPPVGPRYGQGSEAMFFERVPVPLDEAPRYEIMDNSVPEIPEYEGDGESISTGGALAGLAAPAAGGYIGKNVGNFMSQGKSFGDALSATGGAFKTDVASLFGSNASNATTGFAGAAPVTNAAGQLAGSGSAGSIVTNASTSGGVSAAPSAGISASPSASGNVASSFGDKLTSGSTIGGGLGVGFGTALAGLVTGQSPAKAAKSGLGSGVGYAIGTAAGGPVGGFIGGALGGALGGRVICTELCRQGLMDWDLLDLDIAFSKKNISDTTRAGYYVWAPRLVSQMQKRKWVALAIRPFAIARAEEIAHIMGAREKPHWGGRMVRLVGETMCWALGTGKRLLDTFNPEQEITA